jgi:hypothetical protein
VVIGIEKRDLVRPLQHLHADIEEDERHAARPALIAWGRIGPTCPGGPSADVSTNGWRS